MPPASKHAKQHDLRGASLVRIGQRLRTKAKAIAAEQGCDKVLPPDKLPHPPIDHSVTTYLLHLFAEAIEEEGKAARKMR